MSFLVWGSVIICFCIFWRCKQSCYWIKKSVSGTLIDIFHFCAGGGIAFSSWILRFFLQDMVCYRKQNQLLFNGDSLYDDLLLCALAVNFSAFIELFFWCFIIKVMVTSWICWSFIWWIKLKRFCFCKIFSIWSLFFAINVQHRIHFLVWHTYDLIYNN